MVQIKVSAGPYLGFESDTCNFRSSLYAFECVSLELCYSSIVSAVFVIPCKNASFLLHLAVSFSSTGWRLLIW